MLERNRLTCFDGALPGIDHARDVVRMDGVAGRPLLQFLGSLSEVLQGLAVDNLDLAGSAMGRNKSRNAVEDQAQALLIRLEGLLGALPVVDVGVRSEPLDNHSLVVERRSRPEEKPAIHAIEAPEASFNFTWLASSQNGSPVIDKPFQIVRVQGNGPAPITRLFDREAGKVEPAPI